MSLAGRGMTSTYFPVINIPSERMKNARLHSYVLPTHNYVYCFLKAVPDYINLKI